MLQLHKLKPLKKSRKRVGRGGSRGGTSGRGHKGQRSRSGGPRELKYFFEGGQMPLSRRLPKRGFNNSFRKEFTVVSLQDLELHFSADDVVDRAALEKKGLVKRRVTRVKILVKGTLSKKLAVCADACSKAAAQAIEKAGGSFVIAKEMEGGSTGS